MTDAQFRAACDRDIRAMQQQHPRTPKARDDGSIGLLVALFARANEVDEERVWGLIECAFTCGRLSGFEHAMTVVHEAQRTAEAEEAGLRA